MYKPAPLPKTNIGLWVSSFHPLYLEAILETNSYDWLALDLEHGAFSENDARDVFILCQRFGVHAFARLKGHDHLEGRKMLDLGATGLIIPVVNSAEEMENLCKHFFYPPQGFRGVCLSRINKYGETFDEYYKTFRPLIVPQIENRRGVENIEAITNLPYVTGVFIGPYDLSADLGYPGQFQQEDVKKAVTKVQNVVKATGKGLGIHVVQPDLNDLKKRIDEGFTFIAYGTDIILLKASLKGLAELKNNQQVRG